MNAEVIEKHLEVLAEAEGGVGRLRELILQLAVMGRLVEQDPAAQPESLHGMESGNEPPFQLPTNWRWVSMGGIAKKLGAGSTPLGGEKSYVTDGVKFLRSQNVWNSGLILDGVARIPRATHEKMSGTWVQPGDLLLNITGASIGRCALIPEQFDEANVSQHVSIVRLTDKRYGEFVHLAIISPLIQNQIDSVQVGISREGLSMGRLKNFGIPLPPVSEQARIVGKVDELMSLCDELERRQQRRHSLRRAAHTAALDALTQAATPDELSAAWVRVKEHWNVLAAHPDAVPPLRQAILQLAVQGQLVRQDMGATVGSKPGVVPQKGRQTGPERSSSAEVSPPLPRGWCWETLGTSFDVRDGTHDTPSYEQEGVPLVTSKNISSGRLVLAGCKLISMEDHLEISRRSKVDKGDILFAMIGSIGNPVMVDTNESFSIKNVALFKTGTNHSMEYLLIFLRHAARIMKQTAVGAVQSFVSLGYLRSYPIPLPPLTEQKRIVAKVEELMSLCDELERRAQEREEILSRAAQAAVGVMTGAGDGPR